MNFEIRGIFSQAKSVIFKMRGGFFRRLNGMADMSFVGGIPLLTIKNVIL